MRKRNFFSLVLVGLMALNATPLEALRKQQRQWRDEREALQGKWKNCDGDACFVFSLDDGESYIQIKNEATTTTYPITWKANRKEIEIRYVAEPTVDTIDIYYEAFWRPTVPKYPGPLAYQLSRDGKSLSIAERILLSRVSE
ncbi:MAG: hypothetical protein KDK78_05370 [Chlamydiia bacterium]|nr:hypothetical protein [Chlamydiia bacterium]